jgi:hypothetical protein
VFLNANKFRVVVKPISEQEEPMNMKDDSEITELISKLKTQVQNWPKNRWKLLSIGLILFFLGTYMTCSSLPDLLLNRSVLDKIQLEKKPEELSTELWLIAEVRRSVVCQEIHGQCIALSGIACMTGIMTQVLPFLILVPLIMHWKDGGREIQVIRLLLAHHEELQENKRNMPG